MTHSAAVLHSTVGVGAGVSKFRSASSLAGAPIFRRDAGYNRPISEFSKLTGGVARTVVGTVVAVTASLHSPTINVGGHHEVLQIEAAPDLKVPYHQEGAAKEMQSYRGLPDGWDGPGSLAPSDRTIDTALVFLASLPLETHRPEAGATYEGSAEWYWRSSKGRAAVSFRDNLMTYYVRVGDRVESGSTKISSLSWPADLLKSLQLI